jgi:hypothetical protein
MFVKFGDSTKSFSTKETNKLCNKCKKQIIVIDNKETCECFDFEKLNKISKIITQNNSSTNFKEFNEK